MHLTQHFWSKIKNNIKIKFGCFDATKSPNAKSISWPFKLPTLEQSKNQLPLNNSTCLWVAGRRSEGMKVTPWEGRLPPGEELQPPREEPPLAQGVDTTADSQQVLLESNYNYHQHLKLRLKLTVSVQEMKIYILIRSLGPLLQNIYGLIPQAIKTVCTKMSNISLKTLTVIQVIL